MHAIRKMNGKKQSFIRAKTSIGLKSSHRECMESVSELLVALEKERQMEQVIMKSVEQWTEIVDEITTSMDSATPSETEWKNRFHYQRLFNEMLTQEIGHIKTELYMLGQSRTGMTLPVTEHSQSKSPRSNHHRESQTYIKCLQEKLKSLESLYNMYEHQRDDASRDYYRLKEEINRIVKDVAFKQKTTILSQEKSDKKELTRAKGAEKTLPPLKGSGRNKTSYLKLHEVNSVTSKIADKAKPGQLWKGARKLPPINNTKCNGKDKNLSSDKSKRSQGVQKKWKNVTKADVIPPIGKANGTRKASKSEDSGEGHRDKTLVTYPKVPSMRMKRIACLKTDSDGVTSTAISKGRVRDDFTETNEVTDTHEDCVCHVDDTRVVSTYNDDVEQTGISTGYDTQRSIGDKSEGNRERSVKNKCGENNENDSLGRKSPIVTPVRSPLRKSPLDGVFSEKHDDYEHEFFPVGNVSPKSKLPRKRLKTALVRSNSKDCNGDGRSMDVSPCPIGVTPSGRENQTSTVYKESVSPLNTITDNVNMAEDTVDTGAGRSNVYMAEDTVDTGAGQSNVDMAEDTLYTKTWWENTEHHNAENGTRSPKSKRKSVTINDKTTIHYP